MAKKDKKPPTPSLSSEEEEVAVEQAEEEEASIDESLSSSDASEEEEVVPQPKAVPKKGGVQNEKDDLQVFVSGIPYECNEQELRDFFPANVQALIKEVKLPRYQDSGRCRGYAHITFTSEEGREAALLQNKNKLKGRYLEIALAQGKNNQAFSKDYTKSIAESMPDDCKTLFVKGLPYAFKEDDVGDRFRRFGAIKSIRLAYNWMTKQSKGFAYINFDSHESAKRALQEMNGKEVQGRRIKVDFDVVQEPKKGYKINAVQSDRNKLYNKEVIKEEVSKRKKKQKDKQRVAMTRITKVK